MKEISKFRIWARKTGHWTLDQLADEQMESETLNAAHDAWMAAKDPQWNQAFEDWVEWMWGGYFDDEMDECEYDEAGWEIEYAHPILYIAYEAWKAALA